MKHYPAVEGAIFSSDSPFRRVPSELNPTQRQFLEAIRLTIEMTQLSSQRLRHVLTALSMDPAQQSMNHYDIVTSGFFDAWSMVDTIHRLRELLMAMPRIKKGGGLLQVFLRATSAAEELRNRVQHLKGDLVNPRTAALPVWGTISWLWIVDQSLTQFKSGVLTAGPETGTARLILNPAAERVYHDQLDSITLSVGQNHLNLSEAMRIIIRIARSAEKMMRCQFEGKDVLTPVDLCMVLDWVVSNENVS